MTFVCRLLSQPTWKPSSIRLEIGKPASNMEPMLAWTSRAAAYLHWCVLGKWLWDLFRFGPRLTASGFWAGLPDEDVCALLAPGTRVADWTVAATGMPSSGCEALVFRSFQSFLVLVHTILYITVLVCASRMLCRRADHAHLARRVALELRAAHD